jgi:hypothetical protein
MFISQLWAKTTYFLRFSVTQVIWSLALITVIITTTRMHRYLVVYASGSLGTYDTLNLLYLLSYSTPEISFQGYRTGE